jgi:hypothetical protein
MPPEDMNHMMAPREGEVQGDIHSEIDLHDKRNGKHDSEQPLGVADNGSTQRCPSSPPPWKRQRVDVVSDSNPRVSVSRRRRRTEAILNALQCEELSSYVTDLHNV